MVFPREEIYNKIEIVPTYGDNLHQLYQREVDEHIDRHYGVSGDSVACDKGWFLEQQELYPQNQPWILPVRMTSECISRILAIVTSEGEKSVVSHFYVNYQRDSAARKISFADMIKGNYIKINHWLYSHGIPPALFENIEAYRVEKFKVTSELYKRQWMSILWSEQTYRDDLRDTRLAPRWDDEYNRVNMQYPSHYTAQDDAALLLTIDRQWEILHCELSILECTYPTECELFDFICHDKGQFSKDFVIVWDPDKTHPDLRAIWDDAPGEHHAY